MNLNLLLVVEETHTVVADVLVIGDIEQAGWVD